MPTALLTFTKKGTRDAVYRNRLNIKQSPLCKHIWINENLDIQQRKGRAILRTVVDFAQNQGREARVVGDQIVISGIKYNYESLKNLPEQLSLKRVFTCMEDQYVYLQSEFSPHSSFAPVNFNYKGNPHSSAEQAFCFQKAVGNNRPVLAKSVLETHDPRLCKAITAVIKPSQQWLDQEKAEMTDIVSTKYQTPELHQGTKNGERMPLSGPKR